MLFFCQAESSARNGMLPIGKPVFNSRVWLGPGGEIRVASRNLADGYIGPDGGHKVDAVFRVLDFADAKIALCKLANRAGEEKEESL